MKLTILFLILLIQVNVRADIKVYCDIKVWSKDRQKVIADAEMVEQSDAEVAGYKFVKFVYTDGAFSLEIWKNDELLTHALYGPLAGDQRTSLAYYESSKSKGQTGGAALFCNLPIKQLK